MFDIVFVVGSVSTKKVALLLKSFFKLKGIESGILYAYSETDVDSSDLVIPYSGSLLDILKFEVCPVRICEPNFLNPKVVVSLCGNPFGPGKKVLSFYMKKNINLVRYAQGIYHDKLKLKYSLYSLYNSIRYNFPNAPSHFSGFCTEVFTPYKIPIWAINKNSIDCFYSQDLQIILEKDVTNRSKPKVPRVLLVGQVGYELDLISVSLPLIKEAMRNGYKIYYRPHPRSNLSGEFLSELYINDIIVDDQPGLLYSLLGSEVIVGLFSTVLFQAANLKKTVVTLDYNKYEILNRFPRSYVYSFDESMDKDFIINSIEKLDAWDIENDIFLKRIWEFLY